MEFLDALSLLTQDQGLEKIKRTITCEGMHLNLTRHTMPEQALSIFNRWLANQNFEKRKADLFEGKIVNPSEGRAALHTRLRSYQDNGFDYCGDNIKERVDESLQKMSRLIDAIHAQMHRPNATPIKNVVHIGVGGSHLGPQLCYEALLNYRVNHLQVHFVSVMDEEPLVNLLSELNPHETIIVLVSKSFGTEEMLCQADRVKQWLNNASIDPAKHLYACTANPQRAINYGVKAEFTLPFWSWVGGRYSLWSSVSFSVALAIGMKNFRLLLKGAQSMDTHFLSQPLEHNIPIIMACLSGWYTNICGCQTHAIIPYTYKLHYLPAYLQQLQMESLGKSINLENKPNMLLASPIIFGDVGTRSQHALSQFIMQAPLTVPMDVLYLDDDSDASNYRLKIHAMAQSEVLHDGFKDPDHPYKNINAQHPHSLIQLDALTPYTLGLLLSAYEHKTFTLGVLYHLNVFDQWGVERGKLIAQESIKHRS